MKLKKIISTLQNPSETLRVLKDRELEKFGENRARRLVLETWDKLERGELV